MFTSWQPVKIVDPDHPHTGTGGVVMATQADAEGKWPVKVDRTGEVETFAPEQLQAL